MTDLNTLIPVGSNWTLQNASGINKDGHIVGSGANPDGLSRAFLFNPSAK
jgi:probable HAF family extracellular repeat protein